jgi:hypothetical protein
MKSNHRRILYCTPKPDNATLIGLFLDGELCSIESVPAAYPTFLGVNRTLIEAVLLGAILKDGPPASKKKYSPVTVTVPVNSAFDAFELVIPIPPVFPLGVMCVLPKSMYVRGTSISITVFVSGGVLLDC